VVRPVTRPFGERPSIVIMHGSLAPGGAVVKRPVHDTGEQVFRGRALRYATRDEALAGLSAGEIQPGHVVVLGGLGPVGGPGMALGSALVFALDGAGLGDSVALVTDGQMSGLVNTGTVVGEVCPEAAVGGPLALVEDGDPIVIDLVRRRVDLDVPADELERRALQWAERTQVQPDTGWLSIYRQLVSPVAAGAVLTPPSHSRPGVPAGTPSQEKTAP
jgi:dihydroxy-acid dehydratase